MGRENERRKTDRSTREKIQRDVHVGRQQSVGEKRRELKEESPMCEGKETKDKGIQPSAGAEKRDEGRQTAGLGKKDKEM